MDYNVVLGGGVCDGLCVVEGVDGVDFEVLV